MTQALIADPVGAVLARARHFKGTQEVPRGSNRGVAIDYFLLNVGVGLGNPWCAAGASQVGLEALGAAWPVPRNALVQGIVDWAVPRKLLVDVPEVGDLFVIYFAELHRYAHIGFVAALGPLPQFTSLEGNTDPQHSREGYGFFEVSRVWKPTYKAIRWVNALSS